MNNDNSFFSSRVAVKESSTIAQATKAAEMKDAGIDVISLAVGEPNFFPNEKIKYSGIESLVKNLTKYAPLKGIKDLRNAIKDKYSKFGYDLNQIVINVGAKQVIFNALFATLNSGDEVIIPAPSWASYFDIVKMFGGISVPVLTTVENGFKMTPSDLEKAITSKTKWLILNSPSNPTGAVYSKKELKALCDVLSKYKQVQIMSDEIYEHLVFGETEFSSILDVADDEINNRVLIVNGFSKGFALTGLRIGYGLSKNVELLNKMTIIQSQCTSSVATVSQYMALACLKDDRSYLLEVNRNLKKLAKYAFDELSTIGIKVPMPDGAFYLFFSIENLIGKKTSEGAVIENCESFTNLLLKNKYVVVCAGVDFGIKNFIRISIAVSESELKEAMSRIKDFVNNIS